MNTQQRIDEIAEELRALYNNTNEGPRLIAEMVECLFPKSLELALLPITDKLEGESEGLQEEIDELEAEILELKRVLELKSKIHALEDEEVD